MALWPTWSTTLSLYQWCCIYSFISLYQTKNILRGIFNFLFLEYNITDNGSVADDKGARRKVPTLIPSHSVCFKEGPRLNETLYQLGAFNYTLAAGLLSCWTAYCSIDDVFQSSLVIVQHIVSNNKTTVFPSLPSLVFL